MADDYGIDWSALEKEDNAKHWRQKLSKLPGSELKKAPPRSMWTRFIESIDDTLRHYGPGALIARQLAPLVETGDGSTPAQRKAKIVQKERDWREIRALDDPADSVGDYVADFGGGIVGSALDPTNLVGGPVTKHIGKRIATAAGVGFGADAVMQGGEILEGVRDEYDPVQGAINVAAGPAIVGGAHAVGAGSRALSGRNRSRAAQNTDAPLMPVKGRITSGFGLRRAPKAGASTNHGGVDIAAPIGTRVLAPAEGRVSRVGRGHSKRGNWVEIEHPDGTTSRYLHLQNFSVKPGDVVGRGDVFAKSGATGNVTGPHLHWSLMKDGKQINPLNHQFGGARSSALAEVETAAGTGDRKMFRRAQREYGLDDESMAAMQAAARSADDSDDLLTQKPDSEDLIDDAAFDMAISRYSDETGIAPDALKDQYYNATIGDDITDAINIRKRDALAEMQGPGGKIVPFPGNPLHPLQRDAGLRQPSARPYSDHGLPPEILDNAHQFSPEHMAEMARRARRGEQIDYEHELRYADELEDQITARERQDMDASVPDHRRPAPLDNYHEKFTPYPKQKTPANDRVRSNYNEHRKATDYTDQEWATLNNEQKQHALRLDQKPRLVEEPLPSPEDVKWASEQGAYDLRSARKLLAKRDAALKNEKPQSRLDKFRENLVNMLNDDSGSYRMDRDTRDTSGDYDSLDSEGKLLKAVREKTPASAEQRAKYRQERSERAGRVDRIQQEGRGLEGYHQQLAALRGQMPRVDNESIADHFTEQDVTNLLNKINSTTTLLPLEKVKAQTALMNLLGTEGSKVPTAGEIKLLSQVYSEDFIQALLDNREFMEKFWHNVGSAINLPRALMSSIDVSAPLRQGVGFIHKKEFWKAFATMYKVFGSETASKALMTEIKSRPSWELMSRARLAITDPHSHYLADREEAFMSDWAESKVAKAMGIGYGVAASNRAYAGFLNKLRADVFDDYIRKYEAAGINVATDTKKLREIASFINAATGRGNLGKWGNSAAPALALGLFSPRLIASRVQMLYNPATYIRRDPILRKEAWKTAGAYAAYVSGVLALGAQGLGWDVELDSRSPDFAKVKKGNVRVDMTGGFQPYVRLLAQVLTHTKKKANGEVVDLGGGLNDAPKGPYDESLADTLGRFIRSKESPIASLVHNFLAGENVVGEDFKRTTEIAGAKVPDELLERVVPMTLKDLSEVFADSGFAMAVGLAPLALHGGSVQTYEAKKPKDKKSNQKDELGIDWSSLTGEKKQKKTESSTDFGIDWSALE